jgi:Arc/MetJ-type ribon-helix-helix transcriptional regulator
MEKIEKVPKGHSIYTGMRIESPSGDYMNVNLGAPYEAIIQKFIERGYAGNQTEVIRQALLAYNRQIDEEEVRLVNKAVEQEMEGIRNGKIKTVPFEEVMKKAGRR